MLALAACTTEAEAIAEMEAALTATSATVDIALVLSELTWYATSPPSAPTSALRHSGLGCPAISRFGPSDIEFETTLDYPPDGCIPTTGWIPDLLAGHAVAAVSDENSKVNWSFLEFQIGLRRAVESPGLAGSLATDGVTFEATLSGDLSVDGMDVALDALHMTNDGERVTVDGSATVDDIPVTVINLLLEQDDVLGPCPVPREGRAEATPGAKPVTIDFDAGGPDLVDVTRGRRQATAEPFCDHASTVF